MVVVWLAFLALFLGLEIYALATRKVTLSTVLIELFSLRQKGPYWKLRRILFVCIVAYVVVHLITAGGFF